MLFHLSFTTASTSTASFTSDVASSSHLFHSTSSSFFFLTFSFFLCYFVVDFPTVASSTSLCLCCLASSSFIFLFSFDSTTFVSFPFPLFLTCFCFEGCFHCLSHVICCCLFFCLLLGFLNSFFICYPSQWISPPFEYHIVVCPHTVVDFLFFPNINLQSHL
jgi:hypothetical protein